MLLTLSIKGMNKQEATEYALWLINAGSVILRNLSQGIDTPDMEYNTPAPAKRPPELQELGRVMASWGVMG